MERADLERELERLHPGSFGWAVACCRYDTSEAEETLQACYLKVLEGRARYDGRSSVKTWLFGVIRHTAAERRRRSLFALSALSRLFLGETNALAPAPQQAVEDSERRSRLRSLLGALPPRQREVLELVFYQELTVDEAAGVMGVSVGSARVHYARGKRRLLASLGGPVDELA